MANGFALKGFTTGLTQGLQNANELYNSYVNRDLARAESERLRKGQETQDRWYAAQAKNMEMDNDRQERMLKLNEQKGGLDIRKSELDLAQEELKAEQLRKQAEYPRIYGILNKQGNFTEDDFKALNDFGLGPLLSGEDDSAELKRLAEGVRSGQLAVDDPEVANKLLPALTPMLNRRPGSVGVDPNTGQQIRITDKTPIGFQRLQGRAIPMLRVRGANAEGQAVEYVAPATQFASSSKDDPLLELTQSEAARRLTGAAWLNRQAARNPELRKSLLDYASLQANGVPKPISARDEAYINNQNALTAKNQLEALQKRLEIGDYGSRSELEKQIKQAELNLKRAQSDTELSKQDRNYATADYQDRRGLGGVSKQKKAPVFKDKPVMDRAKMLYPVDNEGPGMPIPADQQRRRLEYFNTVQGLVNTGGAELDQAMDLAQNGAPVRGIKTPDGRSFDGIKTVINGKTQYIPYRWN